MPSFLKQFSEIWGRFKPAQKFAVAGAAILTLAVVGALAYYGTRSEFGVLFSDLKPEDAQQIVEQLKTENIPYTLTQGGTTVSVPVERVTELRLQLAASGALSGGHVGFDIFDKSSFGATDFAQQVNYQRAIEGELARTLEAMDEVETARVHVTRPRESLFADKEERAKASVMLRVRQGRELSRDRVGAAINLVASAVEGLDPADISVMDTRGRLLSAPSNNTGGVIGGDSASFNSHLDARRRLEAETAARVVALLEPVTGADHARADVAAELDFSSVEQTEEKYDPKSAVIRSQQSAAESRNSTQGGQGGISGARANDPTIPPAPVATNATASGDQRQATTTNYEIDKIVRRTVGGGGRLTRLSVSVVVDYKNANGTQVARTPEEMQKIQELVAAAVGINQERGDRVVVQTMPFNQPAAEETTQSFVERYRDLINTAIKYSLLVFAVLLLLLFVVRPVKRMLRANVQTVEPQLLPAGVSAELALAGDTVRLSEGAQALVEGSQPALEAGSPEEIALAAAPARTVAELEAEMEAEVAREVASFAPVVRRATAVKKQLLERTQTEPELLAMTLRAWLQEAKN